jgi:hypothetical protein
MTHDNESLEVRQYEFGYRQIIINESPAIGDMGYCLSNAWTLPIKHCAKWNPSSKVLTLPNLYCTHGLLGFKFESQKKVPLLEFSVCIRHKNAIVQKGSSFSGTEGRQFYEFLKDHWQQDETDLILASSDGEQFRVVVSSVKDVHNWRIFEVHVDDVELGRLKRKTTTTAHEGTSDSRVTQRRLIEPEYLRS